MSTTTAVKHISSPDAEAIITSYINNHPQGVLTTLDKTGAPQSSVVNLFELDNYHRAFMTKKTTRKYKNLQNNKDVSFLTYDPFSRTEVEIEGVVYGVIDKSQEEEIIQIIADDARKGRRHISPYVRDTDDYALFIIYPRKIHMVTYWAHDKGIEAYHESIEFSLQIKS
ncbi:MAG TPA: pyridoxamine 5'-phosphate oxidase family protein [Dongiaceae bacterium]|nr:pyridoxamine 5'-phosphate oxidase family protein [Dongiaceae bacterium]